MRWREEQVAELVNELSVIASNRIHEYASTFGLKLDYKPLEDLAQAVQREIVQKGSAALNLGPL